MDQPTFAAALGQPWWWVLLAVLAGAALGLFSAWATVAIEAWQKLAETEVEERAEYDQENQAAVAKAEAAGKRPPKFPPWPSESYGWTWKERYLLPIMTGLLFGLFVWHQGANRLSLIHLFWVVVLVHIVSFDLKHHLVLNVITFPGIVLALALAAVTPGLTVLSALAGGAIDGVLFLMLYWLGFIMFRHGLGFGDVKLAALLGAICAFDINQFQFGAMYALVYGVFLGAAGAVLLVITRLRSLRDGVAYAPYLCAGALIVLYQFI